MQHDDFSQRIASDIARVRSKAERTAAQLSRLQQELRELEAAQAVLHRYESQGEGHTGDSLQERVIEVVQSADGMMAISDIADDVLASFPYDKDRDALIRSLRGILSRAHKEGRVVNVARGLYAAPGVHVPGDTIVNDGVEATVGGGDDSL